MTQPVEVFAYEASNLNLMSKTHLKAEENWLHKIVVWHLL